MPSKLFANELTGPAWDRVRAIRGELFGDRRRQGEPLDPERVPEIFHHLLPYASLLTTGEEGALCDFFDVLDEPTRDTLMFAIEPLVEQLRAYGLDGTEGLKPREQKRPAPASGGFDFSAQRLHEMLDDLAAQMKNNGPTPPEQHVMLDLVRFYDLNEQRWVRPRKRSGS